MFPPDPNYVPQPEAARLLARLIEFGYAPDERPDLDAHWGEAFTAVARLKHRTRLTRWHEFLEVTRNFPNAYEMSIEVTEQSTGVEDRSVKSRIFYQAKDALHDPPELKWLVEGLITGSSLNLLVGDAGSKKTLLAIDLAVSVAIGTPWLGFPVSRGAALYVDEETGIHRLWGHMHAALNGHDAPASTPLDFVSLGGYDLRSESDAQALTQRALSFDSRLIVIDALVDVARGGDENSSAGVQPVLFNLRRMADYCQAAVLVIHHNNRQGGFRGSSAIAAGVDLMLGVESAPTDPLVNLFAVKARHHVPPPITARAHFENSLEGKLQKVWFTNSNEKRSPRPKPARSTSATVILDFLATRQESTTDQIVAALGITLGTARNVIQQLKIAQLIERDDKFGASEKGKRAVYRLTAQGRQLFEAPKELTFNESPEIGSDDDD
ncbi:MAG: AAA family ATPase [Anaerolineales bacterium]